MAVTLAYIVFIPLAALCFVRLPLRAAILLVLIGGWWLLPVARYPAAAAGPDIPWWITGIALPSDMLVTKAWVAPLAAFMGAVTRDRAAFVRWRPKALDLTMAAWCLWPLTGFLRSAPDPAPWLAALYVTGSWGLPWLIGRVWFARSGDALLLMRAVALSGLANVPIALIEGFRPANLYGLAYGPHPYRLDGVDRYLGHRPIGFLEHGNAYGLWVALTAFAAIWLALRERGSPHGRRWIVLAVVNLAVAVASQSIGALLLLGLGLVLLAAWRLPIFMPAMVGGAMMLAAVSAVHLSGVVPLQSIAQSPVGARLISTMRSVGRGSLLWRVSQDAKTLPGIAAHPVTGNAIWDWWRPFGIRPWGQPLLLIGQFGLAGLLLAWGALIGAVVAALRRLRESGEPEGRDAALPLAILVLLTLVDAILNAFFFSLAIVAAGVIAPTSPARRDKKAKP